MPADAMPTFDALEGYALPAGALAGHVLLITGAADGIGRALARACAQCGASLILLDYNHSGLAAIGDACIAAGASNVEKVQLDLAHATPRDYHQLADRIRNQYGRLDALVNNAGWVGDLTPFEHVEPQNWAKVFAVNLAAPFFLTQWCMPVLALSKDPVVIFALHATSRAYWSPYASAKGGLEALLHSLADEYHLASSHPVRIVGIDPGVVDTAQRRQNYPGEAPATHPAPERVLGPYLYALGSDARGRTDLVLRKGA